MYHKTNKNYKFNQKRNYKLTTPCCKNNNKDGKFVNYIDLPDTYGYCHSCGKSSLPPPIYTDDKKNEYIWNTALNRYERTYTNTNTTATNNVGNTKHNSSQQQLPTPTNSVANSKPNTNSIPNTKPNSSQQQLPTVTNSVANSKPNTNPIPNSSKQQLPTETNSVANSKPNSTPIKYIPEAEIWKLYNTKIENNLLLYLRKTYGDKAVDLVKELYVLGTNHDGGSIFWNINENLLVQKSKISYYKGNGKRTNKFRVPYKNENGYYSCLFGEHLINKNKKPLIILVESEKTAIVGFINLPKYTWLAYGGLNALTDSKVTPLIGHRVLIVPDISNKAVDVMTKKIAHLKNLGININIWDMTKGKTDEQLKKEGIYNDDLEDCFRRIKNSSNKNS